MAAVQVVKAPLTPWSLMTTCQIMLQQQRGDSDKRCLPTSEAETLSELRNVKSFSAFLTPVFTLAIL